MDSAPVTTNATRAGKALSFSVFAKMSSAATILITLFFIAGSTANAQTETVLYSFGPSPDGAIAESNLAMDGQGNLYGTTVEGGANKYGTLFELAANGTETVLHGFGAAGDGQNPHSGVVMDSSGNLYGTTALGGSANFGTVFEIAANGTESVLHSFAGGSDGANPIDSLIIDSGGNLYGTTQGGANGSSTVFKVAAGSESVIYGFTGADLSSGSLVIDSSGNLYGTIRYGGANNVGSIFEVSQTGTLTTLHDFVKKGRKDGYYPLAGMIMDGSGNLYGSTSRGGAHGNGAIFKLVP